MAKNANLLLLLVILVVIIAAGVGGYYWWLKTGVSNTLSGSDETASWHTVNAVGNGVAFKYPDLPTTYITPQTWPPQIMASTDNFSCVEGGLGINGLPGMTIKKTMQGQTYCIHDTSEGTAGTIYTNYVYTTELKGKLITANFVLGYIECGNFSDPQMAACENERQTFDLDTLINKIFQTVQL